MRIAIIPSMITLAAALSLTAGCGRPLDAFTEDGGVAPDSAAPRQWVIPLAAGAGYSYGHTLSLQDDGEIWVAGTFNNKAAFGALQLDPANANNRKIFVTRVSPAGVPRWAVSAGTDTVGFPRNDLPRTILARKDGTALLTGSAGCDGPMSFGQHKLTSAGQGDLFLTALSSDGQWQWVSTGGGKGVDDGNVMAQDAAGNVYIGGIHTGAAGFGEHWVNAAGGWNALVTKSSSAGKFLWAVSAGGSGFDSVQGMGLDAKGDLLLAGYFQGQAIFGNTTLTARGNKDTFVAKLSPQGKWLWAISGGSTQWDVASAATVDGSGNTYVVGQYYGTFTIGGKSLKARGEHDVFVVKVSPKGALLWAASMGGAGADYAQAVAVDQQGVASLVGTFKGQAQFGAAKLTSRGDADIFVARVSAAGVVSWATSAGGPGRELGYDIALDHQGRAHVTGAFSGQASFGQAQLTSQGHDDGFLWRLPLQ